MTAQELTSLALSADGRYVVYVRGGDHGGNWDGPVAQPASQSRRSRRSRSGRSRSRGGAPKLLGDGDEPVDLAARRPRRVHARSQLWIVPGRRLAPGEDSCSSRAATARSRRLVARRLALAFVSDRGDHSFIGVYSARLDADPLARAVHVARRDAPLVARRTRIAFVRRPGAGGAPEPLARPAPQPVGALDRATPPPARGTCVWKSPTRCAAPCPSTDGGSNLHWAAGDRIVFLADIDGWPHLYSIPATGGTPLLLTPGRLHGGVRLARAPTDASLVYAANTGRRRRTTSIGGTSSACRWIAPRPRC